MRQILKTGTLAATLWVVAALASACWRDQTVPPGPMEPRPSGGPRLLRDLPFGNPTAAGSSDGDNYLIEHRSFALSYNEQRGTANWVAWHTTKADLGDRLERSRFEADPLLPQRMKRVEYWDYSGSGYDRGHMVPAADRFGDEDIMADTFLMTNIVPQSRELNQYPWNELENYARGIVRRGTPVYTIAGVYGERGRLRGRVTVPTNCWKVIVLLDRPEIGAGTRIIAVDMPNIDGIRNKDWGEFITTVREIESKAGVDLLNSLPADLQEAIETKRWRR